MPNIRDYDAPEGLGLQPSDRAAESRANAGRSISRSYDDAAAATRSVGNSLSSGLQAVGEQVVKYMDHREISAGAPTMATALTNLDQAWNKTAKNADPNDPTVAAKFREEVLEPQLEKLKGGFNTERSQAWADAQIDSMRNHFITKTSADMVTLASMAAKQNVETLTNQLSNAAHSDPTSLKTSLDMVDHSIASMVDSSPNLSGAAGAKVKMELAEWSKGQIVKSAAISAIGQNPEAGLAKFSGPEYSKYISGSELQQLQQQAKTVQRAQRVDETYQRKLQDDAKERASDEREGQYLSNLHSGDPELTARVNAKAIANDLTLTRQARERMIGIVERETKPEAASKISNATATDLISRMRAPEGDPRRISDLNPVYEAYEQGKLNKADLKFVREEFAQARTPDGGALGKEQDEFIKSVKPLIDKSNPLLGKIDQSGPQQLYKFTYDLQKKISSYRAAGKDPRDLFDPAKPDYMGNPAALAPYQKDLQSSLGDAASQLRRGNIVSVETSPVATSVPKPPPAPPPQKGTIKDGYEFLGGSPGEAKNWRKVDL